MSFGLVSESNPPEIEAVYRKGEVADAPRLALLLQNHYNWININHSPFGVVQRKSSVRNMEDAIAHFPSVVAEVDEIVVGFVITFPQEPSLMQIRMMYVDDAYRSKGFAGEMLTELEQQILTAGFGMVMATSSTHWYPGKPLPTRLFERSGYEVVKLDADTELYLHKLGQTQPRLSEAEPDQLFGLRSIGYPERD